MRHKLAMIDGYVSPFGDVRPFNVARPFAGPFGEIRAFTGSEIARMQTELARVDAVLGQRESDLAWVKWNPINYVLETQRDAISRLENMQEQYQHIRDQLAQSMDATIESGDTTKLRNWLELAALIGDASDTQIWRDNLQYSSTVDTATNVGAETAKDVAKVATTGLGIGTIIAIAAGALYLLINFGPKRR